MPLIVPCTVFDLICAKQKSVLFSSLALISNYHVLQIHLLQIHVLRIHLLQIHVLQIHVLQIHVLQIHLLQIHLLQIHLLQIHVLQIHLLQIRVLQIHVLQIHLLQIHSMFYKSTPLHVLQYACETAVIYYYITTEFHYAKRDSAYGDVMYGEKR